MKQKCEICEKQAVSFIEYNRIESKRELFLGLIPITRETGKDKVLCLEHLIEEFSIAFLNYPSKMVILPPYLNNKNARVTYGYQFYYMKSLRKGEYITMKKVLESITGKCGMCPDEAQVAFYNEKYIKWKGELPEIGFSEKDTPEIICKNCAIKLITPYLQEFASNFNEGLCAPYGGEGYFMPKWY